MGNSWSRMSWTSQTPRTVRSELLHTSGGGGTLAAPGLGGPHHDHTPTLQMGLSTRAEATQSSPGEGPGCVCDKECGRGPQKRKRASDPWSKGRPWVGAGQLQHRYPQPFWLRGPGSGLGRPQVHFLLTGLAPSPQTCLPLERRRYETAAGHRQGQLCHLQGRRGILGHKQPQAWWS